MNWPPKMNRPAKTFIRACSTTGELGAASRAGGFSAAVVRSRKLHGTYSLVRFHRKGPRDWLLFRRMDAVETEAD